MWLNLLKTILKKSVLEENTCDIWLLLEKEFYFNY